MSGGGKTVDWDLVEADYRAGIKPLRQIAEEHGVSHTAVRKRADKYGWTRDLAARIQAQADAKVSRAAVSSEVSTARAATEAQVVDANAEVQFRIRMEHRADIGRARTLFGKLLTEVELETDGLGLFERLGEMLDQSGEDEKGRLIVDKVNQLYRKVISTGGRVESAKKLTEMLEKLVRLEREAFGISDEKGAGGLEELLRRLGAEAA